MILYKPFDNSNSLVHFYLEISRIFKLSFNVLPKVNCAQLESTIAVFSNHAYSLNVALNCVNH